jgi:hypothetical protein
MNKSQIVWNATPSGVEILYSGFDSGEAQKVYKESVSANKNGGIYQWFGKNRIIRTKRLAVKTTPTKPKKDTQDANYTNN